MTARQWTVAPLVLATAVRDRSQVLLLGPLGFGVPGVVMAWLLVSGNEKILVDTGLGELDTAELKNDFGQSREQLMEPQLMRFDTAPQDIPLVINTHLHVDHCRGNGYFKNARFLVQKREFEYARNPLPVHRPAYHVDLTGMKFELLDGDAQVAPGINVILTPGHSPGSQAVVVETAEGRYVIAGDTITHYENMAVPDGDSFWPGPLYVDLREFYQSLDRLKNLGGIILPGHDPLVLKRKTYP
ncbi:MAG: N-acyl homoserine lactonase family protein [Thermodesulfobacteriota bacterium]